MNQMARSTPDPRYDPRYRAGQRRRVRRSLAISAFTVAGVAAPVGVILAAARPDGAGPVIALYGTVTAVSAAFVAGARRRSRLSPQPLIFVFALFVLGATLLGLVVMPEDRAFSAAILAAVPISVGLLVPWSSRAHVLWLLSAGLLTAVFVASPLMPPALPEADYRDIAMALAVGVVISLVGQRMLESLRLAAFADASLVRARSLELRHVNRELSRALTDVRRLEGLLPICSGCKSIRDEGGAWVPVERYVSDRSATAFSHGLCPDCQQRLYPEHAAAMRSGTSP